MDLSVCRNGFVTHVYFQKIDPMPLPIVRGRSPAKDEERNCALKWIGRGKREIVVINTDIFETADATLPTAVDTIKTILTCFNIVS
jgi:hypothetical protein